MNSMNEAFRVWGFIAMSSVLVTLVVFRAWGALGFIVAGIPVVRWAEAHR